MYNNYGSIGRSLWGTATEGTPEEVAARHRARLESKLEQVTDVVTKLAEMMGS